ncbi:hypothetical protein [Nocardioides ungokensis]|uniref:hypothetical protein n=1 Tax=Nocardioides ungokensis TaxID=1643322 RepID=UPI0015DDEC8A|nr:hypothetical protein [Nocardioides ungokensis]
MAQPLDGRDSRRTDAAEHLLPAAARGPVTDQGVALAGVARGARAGVQGPAHDQRRDGAGRAERGHPRAGPEAPPAGAVT